MAMGKAVGAALEPRGETKAKEQVPPRGQRAWKAGRRAVV